MTRRFRRSVAWPYGAWDALVTVLLVMMVTDFILGVLGVVIRKELSGEVAMKNWRKGR